MEPEIPEPFQSETLDEYEHPESLDPETPKLIEEGLNFISDYGWYILGVGLGVFLLWTKKLKPTYIAWKKRMDDAEYEAKYHKDPDIFRARQETMEAARRRMQQELEKKSQEYMEKQKEIEDAKRLERIADWERHEKGLGYRSKMKYKPDEHQNQSKDPQVKPKLRPEYNPLAGSGSSSGYRPPRRNVCSGGGCG